MVMLSAFENQMTEAVKKLSSSVVNISSTRFARDFHFGFVPVKGAGSGVIIDPRGYIITNNHVIDDADRVNIHLNNGRTVTGNVIGGDSATDIALIRVEANNLPAAELGDSEKLKVGQIAIAIGNSLGLPGGPTVSAGVISALGRPLPGADLIFEGLIQTDASINPGNSGGPLADLNGNVIGINTAMVPYAQGVGFAIPINIVKRLTQQIIEKGRVVRPWLGISGTTINSEIARRYSLPTDTGALVMEIIPKSPAYEAGLRIGDILVQIGSCEIKDMTDILTALSKHSIGEEVAISLLRMGQRYKTSLRLLEAPFQPIK
jgi:S1-C subfamily serine protease